MNFVKIVALSLPFAFLGSVTRAAEAPDVVVSIKPVHSLVASIMEGVGTPKLIVDGAASPHTYNLKPSNARDLQNAKVIFWIGPGFEAFLTKPLEALGSNATIVELDDAPGLAKLKFREGGAFEEHEHEEDAGHAHEDHEAKEEQAHHDHADHEHGEFDTHLWLDPQNAKAMANSITMTLAAADPANAMAYQENAKKLNEKLDALDQELVKELEPVKNKPFVVFHDAYQYFEHRYGVRVVGSITVNPENMPGAERVSEIRQKVSSLNAACVFAEPQFEPKLIDVIIEGTSARSGTLDPEAGTLEAGPDLYFQMMRSMAENIKNCLS